MKTIPFLQTFLVAAFLFVASFAQAQDAVLDRARQLLDSKQAAAAFELLDPLEADRAGEPEYDFLLGLAAIESNRLTRAVFALERVLAVRPDHPRARAEIARAFFLAGENETARKEFEAVKATRPPAEVAATIDRFLDALNTRAEAAKAAGVTAFLEIAYGRDSNLNAATGTSSFAIPLFPGANFQLSPGATSQPGDFTLLAGGVNLRKPLDDGFAVFAGASFDQRLNSGFDRFDTGSLGGSVGASVLRDNDEYTLALQAQTFSVDNARFRDAAGVLAQWRRSFGQDDQLTTYLQRTRLSYPGQSVRDADRTVLGLAWAHGFSGPRAPVMFLGAFFGSEAERTQGFPQFGHDLMGVRLGGQIDLSEKLKLSVNYSFEDRRYGGPDPLFLLDRRDKETSLRVLLPYEITKEWTVIPQLSYVENRSNIVVSDYNRTQIFVALRRDFR